MNIPDVSNSRNKVPVKLSGFTVFFFKLHTKFKFDKCALRVAFVYFESHVLTFCF